jgi:DNA-binding MarR family transcriptional regulator
MSTTKLKCSENFQHIFNLHVIILTIDKFTGDFLQSTVGISYEEFLIMMIVDSRPELTQKEIAESLNQTQSAVSRRIHSLHERKLLIRRESTENRREHSLTLSSKGKQLIGKAYDLLSKESDNLFSCLSKEENLYLGRITQKIIKSLMSNG